MHVNCNSNKQLAKCIISGGDRGIMAPIPFDLCFVAKDQDTLIEQSLLK